jgi:hypothetical protein
MVGVLFAAACAHGSASSAVPQEAAVTNVAPVQESSSAAPTSAASPSPRVSPCPALPPFSQASSAQLIERYGTGLDRYQREGGIWLASLPILINEDFDFASAMMLKGIGPGIAAGKRLANNRKKAELLAAVALSPALLARLDALRAQGIHAFWVLWGADKAKLRLVVDEGLTCAEHKRTMLSEGEAQAFDGPDGWAGGVRLSDGATRLLDGFGDGT